MKKGNVASGNTRPSPVTINSRKKPSSFMHVGSIAKKSYHYQNSKMNSSLIVKHVDLVTHIRHNLIKNDERSKSLKY